MTFLGTHVRAAEDDGAGCRCIADEGGASGILGVLWAGDSREKVGGASLRPLPLTRGRRWVFVSRNNLFNHKILTVLYLKRFIYARDRVHNRGELSTLQIMFAMSSPTVTL